MKGLAIERVSPVKVEGSFPASFFVLKRELDRTVTVTQLSTIFIVPQ